MTVQVARVLQADDTVRHVQLRDDERPDVTVHMAPEVWIDFVRRVQSGEFDHHLPT